MLNLMLKLITFSRTNVSHLERESKMPVVRKEAMVTVRLSPVRKALYRELAAEEGLRLSEWIRLLADYRVMQRTQGIGRGGTA